MQRPFELAGRYIAGGTRECVLTLICDDRPGIVHEVAGFLVEHQANIVESAQFHAALEDRFFMRVRFEGTNGPLDPELLRAEFAGLADRLGMRWELWDTAAPYRTLLMVSQHLHCLNDLLFRWSTGALNLEIPAIVSNHRDAEWLADSYGLDFHHVR